MKIKKFGKAVVKSFDKFLDLTVQKIFSDTLQIDDSVLSGTLTEKQQRKLNRLPEADQAELLAMEEKVASLREDFVAKRDVLQSLKASLESTREILKTREANFKEKESLLNESAREIGIDNPRKLNASLKKSARDINIAYTQQMEERARIEAEYEEAKRVWESKSRSRFNEGIKKVFKKNAAGANLARLKAMVETPLVISHEEGERSVKILRVFALKEEIEDLKIAQSEDFKKTIPLLKAQNNVAESYKKLTDAIKERDVLIQDKLLLAIAPKSSLASERAVDSVSSPSSPVSSVSTPVVVEDLPESVKIAQEIENNKARIKELQSDRDTARDKIAQIAENLAEKDNKINLLSDKLVMARGSKPREELVRSAKQLIQSEKESRKQIQDLEDEINLIREDMIRKNPDRGIVREGLKGLIGVGRNSKIEKMRSRISDMEEHLTPKQEYQRALDLVELNKNLKISRALRGDLERASGVVQNSRAQIDELEKDIEKLEARRVEALRVEMEAKMLAEKAKQKGLEKLTKSQKAKAKAAAEERSDTTNLAITESRRSRIWKFFRRAFKVVRDFVVNLFNSVFKSRPNIAEVSQVDAAKISDREKGVKLEREVSKLLDLTPENLEKHNNSLGAASGEVGVPSRTRSKSIDSDASEETIPVAPKSLTRANSEFSAVSSDSVSSAKSLGLEAIKRKLSMDVGLEAHITPPATPASSSRLESSRGRGK